LSKGKVILFAGACIAILIIAIVVALSNNVLNSNAPTPAPQLVLSVKVTSFNYTGGFGPAGVNIWYTYFLYYENNGTIDANNITLTLNTNSTENTLKTSVYNVTPPHYYIGLMTLGEPYPLGLIKVGEEKGFCGGFEGGGSIEGNADFNIHGFVLIATLKSNETVLDQAVLKFR
jgi:hypothetical protein